jgi:glycerophosphoryl diester phosphodiesterase
VDSRHAAVAVIAPLLTPLPLIVALVTMPSAHGQIVTAHRGASHDAPENTLAAFRLAWEQGADAIEGDFRLTADNAVVCMHDADTRRTCGTDHVVAATPLATLRALDAGTWKSPDFAAERCPTFAEVLGTVPPDRRFFVELKTGPEIVPVLRREIESAGALRASLVVIAFDERTVAACKRELPAIPVHWLTGFEEQPKGSGRWTPTAAEVAATVRRSGADGVGLRGERRVVDRAFVAALAAAGVPEFHVWTVDDPDDARFFAEAGAMGITTNRPALIRTALGR